MKSGGFYLLSVTFRGSVWVICKLCSLTSGNILEFLSKSGCYDLLTAEKNWKNPSYSLCYYEDKPCNCVCPCPEWQVRHIKCKCRCVSLQLCYLPSMAITSAQLILLQWFEVHSAPAHYLQTHLVVWTYNSFPQLRLFGGVDTNKQIIFVFYLHVKTLLCLRLAEHETWTWP